MVSLVCLIHHGEKDSLTASVLNQDCIYLLAHSPHILEGLSMSVELPLIGKHAHRHTYPSLSTVLHTVEGMPWS